MRSHIPLLICAIALSGNAQTQDQTQAQDQAPPATTEQQAAEPPSKRPNVLVIPAQRRGAQPARAQRAKTVDIPQWAKDEGHSGTARYSARIAADGSLLELKLLRSSKSAAIDAAAEAKARTLRFSPARDGDGNAVEGLADVSLRYARYDAQSPGGGLDDYLCADLTREFSWWQSVHEGPKPIFWLHNAFVSLPGFANALNRTVAPINERERQREARDKKWRKLIKRCKKSPETLMLDFVDEPEAYQDLVQVFS